MDSLTYLALIWAAVYLAGVAADKTKLTSVLYFLAFGFIMVNIGLLPVEADPFILGLADIGIVLIMFAIGFEENTNNFIVSIKKSWGIAFFGAVAPFLTAYAVADYFWRDTNIALMCGLAMTATAVSLTMVSLKSEGLQNSRIATRIMTSAVLDDIAALTLIGIMVPLASGQAAPQVMDLILIGGKAILFFVLVSILGVWLLPHDLHSWVRRVPLLGHYGLKHLVIFGGGSQASLVVMLLALVVGLLALSLGFHPAVGAYMAGLIVREEYFQLGDGRSLYQSTKNIIDNAAFLWIGPVFFIHLGTKLVFDWDLFVSVIPQTLIMTAGIFITQIGSAALAARYTGGMDWRQSTMIGFGMLGRAELAFVVMNIAYIENDILTRDVFYTLMFTAFWLNVSVPISIAWGKRYILNSKAIS